VIVVQRLGAAGAGELSCLAKVIRYGNSRATVGKLRYNRNSAADHGAPGCALTEASCGNSCSDCSI